jgi:hypothetical protein
MTFLENAKATFDIIYFDQYNKEQCLSIPLPVCITDSSQLVTVNLDIQQPCGIWYRTELNINPSPTHILEL